MHGSKVFQSPLLGAVPSPGSREKDYDPARVVSIPSSGGSAFTYGGFCVTQEREKFQSPLLGAVPSPLKMCWLTDWERVSIPSSGGSAFTWMLPEEEGSNWFCFNPLFWGQCLHRPTPKPWSPWNPSFNPLFWGQCLHRSRTGRVLRYVSVSIPSSGGSAFTATAAHVWIGPQFQSPLLGAVPSPGFLRLQRKCRLVFQSPLLGAVPSPIQYIPYDKIVYVSIPSSGGSAFTGRFWPGAPPALLVSIPSSGGSAFTGHKSGDA